jgi:hypothetical protein
MPYVLATSDSAAGNGHIKRPEFEGGKCATGCATFGKVSNRTNKTLGPAEEGMFWALLSLAWNDSRQTFFRGGLPSLCL